MLRGGAVLAAVAALLLPLAACAGDDEPTASPTRSFFVATPSPTDEPSPSPSPTPSASATPLPEVVTTLTGFTSPTGNIACLMDADFVRCDISERSWEPPAAPEDCELDYGQGIALDETGAGLVCAGDTVFGDEPQVLEYDHSIRAGDLVCTSRRDGMRCEHEQAGHGFRLSREAYELL